MILETIKNWLKTAINFLSNWFSKEKKHKKNLVKPDHYISTYNRSHVLLQMNQRQSQEVTERLELLEKTVNRVERRIFCYSIRHFHYMKEQDEKIRLLKENNALLSYNKNLLERHVLFFNNNHRPQPSIQAPSIEPVKIQTLSRSI